jgi:hypothetical protein
MPGTRTSKSRRWSSARLRPDRYSAVSVRAGLQFIGRAEEHDLAAALAGAGAHVEQLVGLQHDLRVVLHDDQRVAGVAQALHHVDHASHVARVQADGRLVEHEEGVHERGAERRREVDALHLAAGERARLAVEREVAQADLPQVVRARAQLCHEELGRFVERLRQLELAEEIMEVVDRDEHQLVDVAAVHAPQQRLGLEARAVARRARRVRAVARQQHADVHLVGLGLQPVEEALHAVPVRLAGLVPAHPVVVALHHPALVLRAEVAVAHVERHAALARHLHQVVLALVVALRLERLHRALAQRLRLVGDDEAVVDADHAPEAAARVARADGRVEREARGRRVRVMDVAVGAMQVGGETPRGVGVFLAEYIHASLSDPQRRLDALDHARLLRGGHLHAVLRDLEARAVAVMDARIALRLQQLRDLFLGEVRGNVHRERDHEARIARRGGAFVHLREDRLRRVAAHGLRALAAEELRRAREQQLQVVVDLRHRADRGARGAHRVGLVDGDRRRDSLDGIHLRLVHAVEELARVRGEGLDVAALALGVERVEHKRGLAGTRWARDDDELARGQLDVEVLQIILARAADADRVAVAGCVLLGGRGLLPCGEIVHEKSGVQRADSGTSASRSDGIFVLRGPLWITPHSAPLFYRVIPTNWRREMRFQLRR